MTKVMASCFFLHCVNGNQNDILFIGNPYKWIDVDRR